MLASHGFDRRPYLRLRIKCYVYDHRFEPQLQSDITVRAAAELRKCGLLTGWSAGEEPQAKASSA